MRPNQVYGPADAASDEGWIEDWQRYLRHAFANRHGGTTVWIGHKYVAPREAVTLRVGQIRGARKRLAAYEAGTPYRLDDHYFWRPAA